jgi:hypothetical protein
VGEDGGGGGQRASVWAPRGRGGRARGRCGLPSLLGVHRVCAAASAGAACGCKIRGSSCRAVRLVGNLARLMRCVLLDCGLPLFGPGGVLGPRSVSRETGVRSSGKWQGHRPARPPGPTHHQRQRTGSSHSKPALVRQEPYARIFLRHRPRPRAPARRRSSPAPTDPGEGCLRQPRRGRAGERGGEPPAAVSQCIPRAARAAEAWGSGAGAGKKGSRNARGSGRLARAAPPPFRMHVLPRSRARCWRAPRCRLGKGGERRRWRGTTTFKKIVHGAAAGARQVRAGLEARQPHPARRCRRAGQRPLRAGPASERAARPCDRAARRPPARPP